MNTVSYKEIELDLDCKSCTINKQEINLTKQEFELLLFLMQHPNYVHSRQDLLHLWKGNTSERVVDTTVSRLRKKLGEFSKYLTTRQGYGYNFKLI